METHGADIYTASKLSGIDKFSIIDFSSNINPLGIPMAVKQAAMDGIEGSFRYPDIESRELRESISSYESVPTGWIFASNGAADAIYRIVMHMKPKTGLVTAPAFGEYESALRALGSAVSRYTLREEDNFKIGEDILDSIHEDTDIVFLCNPNNPTGQLTDAETIKKITDRCSKMGAVTVVDECFLDFVRDKEKYSTVKLLGKYENLIVLKAFTKIYAIPGIRLGYCLCSDPHLVEGLKSSGPPWNVSTVAQAAGTAALRETEYVERTVAYVEKQREYLVGELQNLNIKTCESHANYILFRTKETNLKDEMLKRGILIRSCANYEGLGREYFRIAVKTESENRLFIETLKEVTKIL